MYFQLLRNLLSLQCGQSRRRVIRWRDEREFKGEEVYVCTHVCVHQGSRCMDSMECVDSMESVHRTQTKGILQLNESFWDWESGIAEIGKLGHTELLNSGSSQVAMKF